MNSLGKERLMKVCSISPQYQFQGPRFRSLGKTSGEEFRDEHLIPWLSSFEPNTVGIVDFEGTLVFSPSFLEESFGGAIRLGYKDQISKLKFRNIENPWLNKLNEFISTAIQMTKK